MKANNLIKDNW